MAFGKCSNRFTFAREGVQGTASTIFDIPPHSIELLTGKAILAEAQVCASTRYGSGRLVPV